MRVRRDREVDRKQEETDWGKGGRARTKLRDRGGREGDIQKDRGGKARVRELG